MSLGQGIKLRKLGFKDRYKSEETLRRGDSNGDKQNFRNGFYVIGGVTDNLDQATSGAT